MNLTGKVVFECGIPECNGKTEITAEEFDLQETWSDEDRGMGAEIGYDDEVIKNCPKCGENYEVKFECSEYPVGMANYENLSIDKEHRIIENTLTVFN